MNFNQDPLRSQSQPVYEQPQQASGARRSVLSFLSCCIPTCDNHSAFSDVPISDVRNPHARNLFNRFIDTCFQPTVHSRLNDWVCSAQTLTAVEIAVRTELVNVFKNAQARIDENGRLRVEGDISLKNYTLLTALPDDLSVGGYLDLYGCTGLTSLPDNLKVDGDLDLRNCTGLTSLPDNVNVSRNLDLSYCSSLTALPDNLSVSGNLNLSHCTSLTALPDNLKVSQDLHLRSCANLTVLSDNLKVAGNLDLSHCTSLTALPNTISVSGDLRLYGCTSLTVLPDNLSVNGDLYLFGCTGLTALPDNLKVAGSLDLYHCMGLTTLPDNLKVAGNLDLYHCTGLTALPDNLNVGKDLDLSYCTGLTALPDNLKVAGNLDLSHCTGLTALPDNLNVNGDLDLRSCVGLTALPDNLNMSGNFSLSDCMGLTALPDNLKVTGNLDLSHCTGLTALPDNLNVNGDLDLRYCVGLTALPDNLNMSGNLYLSDCTNLMALPDNLSVGRNLNLSHCTNLTALPDNLSVGRDLDLSHCTSLTALPNWVATLDRRRDGSIREVDLTGTGLSEAVLTRLRELNNPNIRIIYGHAEQQYQTYSSLPAALSSWVSKDILQILDAPSWNLDATQEEELRTFLSRLHQTADAQNQNTRPNLQHRIQSFLIQMAQNTDDFRAQALERITQGLESCDDRVILIMNDIEKLTRIREASCSENPEDSLRMLGKSLLALEVVHRHAAAKCQHSLFVDPIEVYLALEIQLANALNLPVSTQNMLFERCANLTEPEIDAAREEALATVNDPQQVNAYLEAWDPWQTHQRSKQVKQLSWSELPCSTVKFDRTDNCVISGQPLSELEDPVAVGQALYSLESFLTWWVQQGTDPATMRRIDLSALEAVSRPNL